MIPKINLAAGLLLIALPVTALSQEPRSDSAGSDEPSPRAARRLAVAGTLVPLGIALVGGTLAAVAGEEEVAAGLGLGGAVLLLPGPSLGYFYGGLPLRALISASARLGGYMGMAGGMALCWENCQGGRGALATVVSWGGVGLFVGSILHDIKRVERDVGRSNGERRGATVIPVVDPSRARAGLAVRLAF